MSNRCDLSKLLSPESFALHCQETSLIVVEQDSFAVELLAKYLILQLKVFNYLFLFLAHGLTEYSEDHLERLEKKWHRAAPNRQKTSASDGTREMSTTSRDVG